MALQRFRGNFSRSIYLSGGNETKYCMYPLMLDTYIRGCRHNCLYCYARDLLAFSHRWNPKSPEPFPFAKIARTFQKAFSEDSCQSPIAKLIGQRLPIRIGNHADPFQPSELIHRATLETLKFLAKLSYPFLLFTKSDLVTRDDYLRTLESRKEYCYIQITITSDNSSLCALMEPGAPSTDRRIRALKFLSEEGFLTAARISPLFPIWPDGQFECTTAPRLDYFDWELVDKILEARPTTLIVGFVRYPKSQADTFYEIFGIPITKFFNPRLSTGLFFFYESSEVLRYYKAIKKKCDSAGVEFSICFDQSQNARGPEFTALWSNPDDCCNALGRRAGFTKVFPDFKDLY